MPRRKAPLPRQYWQLIALIGFLFVLIFAGIFVTKQLTGGRDMGAFNRADWLIFAAFAVIALVLLLLAFLLAREAGMIYTGHLRQLYRSHLHEGLNPADYLCILPDFDGDRRARITRRDGSCHLALDRYDERTGAWLPDGEPRSFPNLTSLQSHLQDECDFCIDPEDFDLLPPETE